jgi:hypothetical protein
VADKTSTSYDSINKKFNSEESKQTVRLKKVKTENTPPPKEYVEQRLREQHLLGILVEVVSLRPVLDVLPLDMFSDDAKAFINSSNKLQQIDLEDEYGKMVLLLFEETYQHTDREELLYQTRSLLGRLIDFYVNSKKTEIIQKLEKSNDKDEQSLLKQVTELQQLKKIAHDKYDFIIKED